MKTQLELKAAIDERLEKLFTDRVVAAKLIDPVYSELITEMGRFIARGGKRLRPYLTYLAYFGYGGKNEDAILELAASQELFHNFLLIHDDIIDGDSRRYSGDNITGRYVKILGKGGLSQADSQHYAVAVALLAGDVNAALAFEAIANSNFDDGLKVTATARMARMIFEIVGGELLDVLLPMEPFTKITEPRLNQVISYKTTSYSFEAPLQLGALMAKAEDAEQDAISQFAMPLGAAFQITDDLLGMFGEEAITGKSITTDLKEGKRTLLIHFGLELAKGMDLIVLKQNLGNKALSESDHNAVVAVLEHCGARAKTEALANNYAQIAKDRLSLLSVTSEVKASLGKLILACVNRQK